MRAVISRNGGKDWLQGPAAGIGCQDWLQTLAAATTAVTCCRDWLQELAAGTVYGMAAGADCMVI